jgi:hypothetical protein
MVEEMDVRLKVARPVAATVLADHVARGKRLLAAGKTVADREEFDFWRFGRGVWTASAGQGLADVYKVAGVVRTFERITRVHPSLEIWSEDLPLELERIREGVEMLESLEEGLVDAVEPGEGLAE